jgi:CelD/BcsL family acetyltransferase involved in cellulose biosynthesis
MQPGNDPDFVLLDLEDDCWTAFVHSHPCANAFHHPAWARLIAECYGYRSFVCAVVGADGRIQAGVPVVEMRSRLTGDRWVSLPYTDFCQPLANSPAALDRLVEGLLGLYRDRQAPRIELRWELPPKTGIEFACEYVLHTLPLSREAQSVFRRFRKSHRYELRKADLGPVRVAQAERKSDFEAFYHLHTQTRRRLGVPVQPKKFFDLFWEQLIQTGLGFVLIAYHQQEPISGAVFLNYNGTVIYKYSASNEAYWRLFPNKLLLWRAIQLSCERGYAVFNFGNSPADNSGLREFKLGWGATETDLIHSYIGATPVRNPDGVSRKVMSGVIRHSPAVVCRFLGELLYKHFG